jgi:O-antigen ligase
MYQKIELFNKNYIFYFFLLIAITIPVGIGINNVAIILTTLISIISFNITKFIENFKSNSISKLFIGFYLIMFISILYSENLKIGFNILSRSVFFLIIPFIFISNYHHVNENKVKKILDYFVYSIFWIGVLFILNAVYNTYIYASVNPLNVSNGNFFSYIKLTSLLKLHPIYFGLFILVSYGYTLLDLTQNKKKLCLNKLVVILFFSILIMLLSSFYLLIVFVVLNSYILIPFIYKKGGKIIFVVTFLIAILSAMYFSSGFIIHKFNGVNIKNDITTLDFSGNDFTAIKARKAKWFCTLQVIKENMLIGTGVGDGNDELFKMYKKYNFLHGIERTYNSHNQYLTTTLYIGIFGLLYLLFLLFAVFKNAVNNKNKITFVFVSVLSLFFITESVLERQVGVVFFVFFSILLTLNKPEADV